LRRDPHQKFLVLIEHAGSAVTLELRDRGPRFDPTHAVVAPRIEQDDRPAGGWGVQLVRRFIDEIRYAREADENVLRLTKRLNEAPGST
jgi:anti-sigma regulatory factor (Ser/Thr protein kinase)